MYSTEMIYGMEVTNVEHVCKIVSELGIQFKTYFNRVVAHGAENFHKKTCYIYCNVSRLPTRIKRMECVDICVASRPDSIQFDTKTMPDDGDKIFYLRGQRIAVWFEMEQSLFLTDITHVDNTFAREVLQNIFLILSGGTIPELLNQIENSERLFLQTKEGTYQIQFLGKAPNDIDVFKEELKKKAEQVLKRARDNYDKSVKALQETFEKKQKEFVLMPEISKTDVFKEGVRIYKQDKCLVYILPMNLNITKVSSHQKVFEIPKKYQIHEKALLKILVVDGKIYDYAVLNLDGSVEYVPHVQGSNEAAHVCLGSASSKLRINVKSMSDIYNARAMFEELMETINLDSLGAPTGRFAKLVDICRALAYDDKLKEEESVWMT